MTLKNLLFKLKIIFFLIRNNLKTKVVSIIVEKTHTPFLVYPIYLNQIVVLHSNGEKRTYSGVDKNKSLSQEKCLSELLEGLYKNDVSLEINKHRSGTAVHINKNLAYKNAYHELIERDSYLMHFFCPILKTFPVISEEKGNFILKVTKLQSVDPTIEVYLSFLKNKTTGYFFLGLSTDEIDKAILESIMLERNFIEPKLKKEKNFFDSHLLQTKDFKVVEIINTIMDGGESLMAPALKNPDVKTLNQKKYKNRFLIELTSSKFLPIEFGEKYLSNEACYNELLERRGLKMREFLLHPLL